MPGPGREPGSLIRLIPGPAAGAHSRASSGRLARGDYQLKVRGPGVSWWTPVSLSRTQEVELELLSWLDLGVAALAGLVVLVGLPLLGRRLHQRGRRAVAGAAVADRDVLEQAKP